MSEREYYVDADDQMMVDADDKMVGTLEKIANNLEKVLVGIAMCAGLLGFIALLMFLKLLVELGK